MQSSGISVTVLVADDDADDRLLIQDAFRESKLNNPLHFVEDGEQLLQYLMREGQFAQFSGHPLPGLILLDLNMPKMDGRAALAKIKQDERLCRIPIVILTTSKTEEDILRTYNLKANSFITKPVTFDGLLEVVQTIANYWIEIVALPPECMHTAA